MPSFSKETNGKMITVTDDCDGVRTTRRYDSIREMPLEYLTLFLAQEYSNMPKDIADVWAAQWFANLRLLGKTNKRFKRR